MEIIGLEEPDAEKGSERTNMEEEQYLFEEEDFFSSLKPRNQI